MKILNYEEAKLANLILILTRIAGPIDKIFTQATLVERIEQHFDWVPPILQFEKIVALLPKMIEWGLITRDYTGGFKPMLASDYSHNLLHPHSLSVWHQINIFSPVAWPYQSMATLDRADYYEVMSFKHADFGDRARWTETIDVIQRDPVYLLPGADILHTAIARIDRELKKMEGKSIVLWVNASEISTHIQLALFKKYPLLSPIIIQVFLEHWFMENCLTMVRVKVAYHTGMTEAIFEVSRVDEIPSVETCRNAVRQMHPK